MPFGFRRSPPIHVDLRTRDGFSGVHKLTDMIFDTLDQLNRYRGLGPRFARAFDFVKTLDVNTPDGRIDLEGDDLFVLVQSYQTQPESEKVFESHRIYADIQVVLAGEETLLYAPLKALEVAEPYSEEKDCQLYPMGDGVTRLEAGPGAAALFFPPDGHAPGCASPAGPMPVKKAVVKVRL